MSAEATHNEHSKDEHGHHVMPLWIYLGVFAVLMVLTVVTVAVTYIDLGGTANMILAMAIATFKASLVAMIFMHLWFDNKIYLYCFISSLGCLTIFIVLTMFDTLRRDAVRPENATPIVQEGRIYEEIHRKSEAGEYKNAHGAHGAESSDSDAGHGHEGHDHDHEGHAH